MSETVTQLLDRYDDDLMELARLSTQGMFDKDLYASASEARQQIVDLVAAARREGEAVQQRCEWVATALHGDPMFGPGCDEPLVQQVRALQADLATSRAAQHE